MYTIPEKGKYKMATINPRGCTRSTACMWTRILCLCATYVYAHCDMRGRWAETWEI